MNSFTLNGAPINGSRLDTTVRTVTTALAYAVIAVKPRALRRGVSDIQARADVQARLAAILGYALSLVGRVGTDVLPRVMRRALVTAPASAAISTVRSKTRIALLVAAQASLTTIGRRLLRSPIDLQAPAEVVAAGVRMTRSIADLQAAALVDATGYALRSSGATNLVGSAELLIQVDVIKRVVFDENAVPEQTFLVPYENNLFTVR